MKWLVVLLILVVVVIAFGLWRRTQGGATNRLPGRTTRAAQPPTAQPPTAQPPTVQPETIQPPVIPPAGMPPVFDASAPPLTGDLGSAATPTRLHAAEESGDEVTWAPASEHPPPAAPTEQPLPHPQDGWWHDAEGNKSGDAS